MPSGNFIFGKVICYIKIFLHNSHIRILSQYLLEYLFAVYKIFICKVTFAEEYSCRNIPGVKLKPCLEQVNCLTDITVHKIIICKLNKFRRQRVVSHLILEFCYKIFYYVVIYQFLK